MLSMSKNEKKQRTDRRISRTRCAIQDAFIRLLAEKDLNDITITELSEEADIDRRTFYLHYDSIGEIVDEFEREIAEGLNTLFKVKTSLSIKGIFDTFVILVRKNKIFSVLAANQNFRTQMAFRSKNILKDIIRSYFFAAAEMENGKFEVVLEFLVSGIVGIFIDWIASGQKIPLETLSSYSQEVLTVDWHRFLDMIVESPSKVVFKELPHK